ncbi:glycoside hydrolase family 66 protein [Thermoanaerobacterium saccharolyticum]|uniref:Dextranase n=2 Tax=Thermoanaerobacterium TaxID=28895 RepID=W9EC03_9THEO|nr:MULTISPECIES: glycoside hydrolase family 66 protein [Thermoanaerobacterium]AFK87304.1 hypothetical protein Tsac_2300 [Thermoanaerobacterium saccharolyticum JW/SL-YS485]ETO39602.1 hypothetical protein V518_0278 [Thermoanaerobacterium aotearoense SCUT27]
MLIKDVYPSKAQYLNGENIKIIVELSNKEFKSKSGYIIRCDIFHLNDRILQFESDLKNEELKEFEFNIKCDNESMAGFGVNVSLFNGNELIEGATTSFDVVKNLMYAPRYGFISDFFESDKDDYNDLKELNKFHINLIQFYDWMYRHHELIPPTEKFKDPLGRDLSINVVKQKIELAHEYGMKAMAYGAVYGSESEFFEKHKDWALLNNNDEYYEFANFIYIMDISKECEWHQHIIKEFFNAIKFGFDGIHMDQYGFPKEAVSVKDGLKRLRRLKDDFPELINDAKSYIENNGYDVELIFNAVNNWPIDSVIDSKQDAVYIEVWPPNDTYQDLYNLIANVKKRGTTKQVILAAYMKPFSKSENTNIEYAENATILTMASIFASGGFHLLLGEENGILTEGYYPNYFKISDKRFICELRNYYDFIVRYEELLYGFDIIDDTMTYTGGINEEYVFKGAKFSPIAKVDSVWTIIKEKPGYKIINFINFTGIKNMNWNEGKEKRPNLLRDIEVVALVVEDVKEVFVASPEINHGHPQKISYEYVTHEQGRAIRFIIPELYIWDLVYITVEV